MKPLHEAQEEERAIYHDGGGLVSDQRAWEMLMAEVRYAAIIEEEERIAHESRIEEILKNITT